MKLMLLSLMAAGAFAQAPDLNSIPSYKKEYDVVGGLRIAGSELKGSVDLLVEGFRKFQPNAKISTNFMTSTTATSRARRERRRGACFTARWSTRCRSLGPHGPPAIRHCMC